MEFQNRVLTSDGRELLAQAISSNQRIIFVRAMSSTTYMDDAALVNLRVEDLTGPLGTIKTTSATGNVARIMTEFTNQPVSAKVMTVAVAARLAAQPDAAAIVMLAQSDPTAGIYIPSTAELSTSVQVAFNVVINATGEVEVTPSANVSLGDHERLLERTVTTHADGDPTVGEAQTIYGEKTFKEKMHAFKIDFGSDDYASYIQGSSTQGRMSITAGKTSGPQFHTLTQMTQVNNQYYGYVQIYPTGVIGDSGGGLSIVYDESKYNADHENRVISLRFTTGGYTLSYNGETFRVDGDVKVSGDILPDYYSDMPGNIGSQQKPFASLHATSIYVGGDVLCNGDGITLSVEHANATHSDDRLSCSGSLVIDGMYTSRDLFYDIGEPDKSFANVYAAQFHGCIPTPPYNANSEPEIGTIFLAFIQVNLSQNQSTSVLRSGDAIQVNGPTMLRRPVSHIGPALISATGTITSSNNSVNYTAGVYVVLCYAEFSSANTPTAYALLMRTK